MSQVIPLGPASKMLTTREAAMRLGVSLRTVQLWVEASILPAARTPGGHRRIPYNAVEALAMNMGLEAAVQRAPALPSDAHDTSTHDTRLGRRGQAQSPGLRIVLVARDEQWLAQCVSAMEVFGDAVNLITADNGYLGLLQIGREAPDLLVTTLELPGMDGVAMLNTLQRAESLEGMRVLALCPPGWAPPHNGGDRLPESVELLSLPVSPEALAIRVGRVLLGRQDTSRSRDLGLQGAHHE